MLDRGKAGERQWEAGWGVASRDGVYAGRESCAQQHHPVKSKQVERRNVLQPHIFRTRLLKTFLPLSQQDFICNTPQNARENKASGHLSSASQYTGAICASSHSVNRGASEALALCDACLTCPWCSWLSGMWEDSGWRLKSEAGINEKDTQDEDSMRFCRQALGGKAQEFSVTQLGTCLSSFWLMLPRYSKTLPLWERVQPLHG